MEYLPNKTLKQMIIDESHSLTPFECSKTKKYLVLLGVALGMNYLHSNGIVYRDPKTENILLDDNLYPKICDFGFSKTTNATITNSFVNSEIGTPFYMAPEIKAKEPYNYKVDVYSFALIINEIITGEHKPIELSLNKEYNTQCFLGKCISNDPFERPTFFDICSFLVKKCFISNFNNVDYDEIQKFF